MQIWLFRVTKVEVCEFNGTGNVYKLTMRTIPTIGSLDSRYLSLKTKTPQNNLGKKQNLLEQGWLWGFFVPSKKSLPPHFSSSENS